MGPLGWPETIFIFVLALLLFGPRKLPELGRTLGKAITEFKRASTELRATFDRELRSIEEENQSLKEVTSEYNPETYYYNYSYDSSYYDGGYDAAFNESTTSDSETSTVGASATEGADAESGLAPEGTVATTAAIAGATEPGVESQTEPPANGAQPAESKA